VYVQEEDGYHARMGWSFEPYSSDVPVAFVDSSNENHIIAAVNCARNLGLGICPRGGGHSRIGSSMCRGVVIDVAQINDVQVSLDKSSATVGAGITAGELAYELFGQSNRLFPIGHNPSVGVVGFTLAGGLSEIANQLGLGCDSLREVHMVKADGSIIIANSSHNRDIFWASQGGGGGRFGIVYRMRLAIYDASPFNSFVGFSANISNSSIIPDYLSWAFGRTELQFNIVSRSKIFFPSKRDSVLELRGVCLNESSQGMCIEKLNRSGILRFPLTNLRFREGSSALDMLQYVATGSVSKSPEDFFVVGGEPHSEGRFQADREIVSALSFQMNQTAAPSRYYFEDFLSYTRVLCRSCTIITQNLGAGITRVNPRSTAIYGLRLATQWIALRAKERTQEQSQSVINQLRAYFGPNAIGAFLNYEDIGLENYPVAYWGNNSRRLARIARKCDPRGLLLSRQPLA